MTIGEFIKELSQINGDEILKSIGTYSGSDRPAEYCIYTDKGDYNIGKKGVEIK